MRRQAWAQTGQTQTQRRQAQTHNPRLGGKTWQALRISPCVRTSPDTSRRTLTRRKTRMDGGRFSFIRRTNSRSGAGSSGPPGPGARASTTRTSTLAAPWCPRSVRAARDSAGACARRAAVRHGSGMYASSSLDCESINPESKKWVKGRWGKNGGMGVGGANR
jgi:hypothetical protein